MAGHNWDSRYFSPSPHALNGLFLRCVPLTFTVRAYVTNITCSTFLGHPPASLLMGAQVSALVLEGILVRQSGQMLMWSQISWWE